jgi:hypothetical protein
VEEPSAEIHGPEILEIASKEKFGHKEKWKEDGKTPFEEDCRTTRHRSGEDMRRCII